MVTHSNPVKAVWETKLPLPLVGRGKVRDIYAVGDDKLLIITSDRLSAFDVVLPQPIPQKGKVLTQISVFWFEYFDSLLPHHWISKIRQGPKEPVTTLVRMSLEEEAQSIIHLFWLRSVIRT